MSFLAAPSWIALQVRPRTERSVAEQLEYRGYECFLPLRDRAPLFPGYLFCHFTSPGSALIVTTPGVVRIVSFGGVPAVIDADEIAALKLALASRLPILPVASLVPGDAVSIVAGPLRGLQGTVVRTGDIRYLIVSITLLRRSIAVEVDAAWVEPHRITSFPDAMHPVGSLVPGATPARTGFGRIAAG